MYIRINKGRFPLERTEIVSKILAKSERTLAPAIKKMVGIQRYQTGIDKKNQTMIAVSIWDTLDHAHAMDTLPEMLAQRPLLEKEGVLFESITLHEILWEI